MDYTHLRSWEQINEYLFLYFLFYCALNPPEEHTVAVVGVFKFVHVHWNPCFTLG